MPRLTDGGLFDDAIIREKWRSKAATANGKQRQIAANLLPPLVAIERLRGCGRHFARQGQGDGVLPILTPFLLTPTPNLPSQMSNVALSSAGVDHVRLLLKILALAV